VKMTDRQNFMGWKCKRWNDALNCRTWNCRTSQRYVYR